MPQEPLMAPKLWTSEQVDRDQLGATSNSVVRHAGPFADRIRDIERWVCKNTVANRVPVFEGRVILGYDQDSYR